MNPVTLSPPAQPEAETPPCGALGRADGSVTWRVWAPAAKTVELALYPEPNECRVLEMKPEPGGYYVHTESEVEEGQRYAFRVDHGPERPDPMSRWQPDGVHSPSAVISTDRFDWSEADWAGLPRKALVIYEVHVGTFTPEGTFDAMIGRLEELRELGITAIELMPVAQFPGARSWGYEGVYPFAVQTSYGGVRGLQRLVNACHRTGLAVILDVVYNHLGPEGNYFAEFGPYFTDHYRTPWGRAINFDSGGCDPVRAFVLENVRYWIRDFHVDGLRLDAVHAFHDESPRHILREIKQAADEEARKLGRPVHVIAESDLNDVRLMNRPEQGGHGLDAQWSDDFHHSVHALLTGERASYYADFGRPEQVVKALAHAFVYDGVYSQFRGRRHGGPPGDHSSDRFVIAIQNHDQIGNRPAGDRLTTLVEPNQLRLAAGLCLLAPQIPLLFMGEEYGETRPFPYFCSFQQAEIIEATRRGRRLEFVAIGAEDEVPDPLGKETFESAKLSWSWPEGSRAAAMRRLYYDLLTIRRFWLPLDESKGAETCLIESWHDASPVLRLVRTLEAGGDRRQFTALYNLSNVRQPLPETELPHGALLLSSEEPRFGGSRGLGDSMDALLPFEFWVFGPGPGAGPGSGSNAGGSRSGTGGTGQIREDHMSSTLAGETVSQPADGPTATPAADAILASVVERLARARMPEATYRLQVNHTFTFRDALGIVEYLSDLGVSDCYFSPYMKACAGSMHGYDIVDHNAFNPEVGTEADYDKLTTALRSRGMGEVLDVVPNHMGVASEDNTWWRDVLENGPASPYASFFDIDWMPLKPDLAYKVLLPILGDQFGKVLEEQQLVLSFEEGAFRLNYFDRHFPIEPRSWATILGQNIEALKSRLPADDPRMLEYQSILTGISHLPPRNETNPEMVAERRREKEVIKRRLADLASGSPEIRAFLDESLALFNGKRGDPHSFDLLEQLLNDQCYRFSYWRVASDEINYRRFFDINELAAICMERPDVFEEAHALIFRLLGEGKANGIRIDHPDGLYDPAEYLWRLQRARFLQLCRQAVDPKLDPEPQTPNANGPEAETTRETQPTPRVAWEEVEAELARRIDAAMQGEKKEPFAEPLYLVVEKILEPAERLPDNWPVYGTTGYDFLNVLNGIFVDRRHAKIFDVLYARFIGYKLEYAELVYQCKKLIMQVAMAAEINVLGHHLDRMSEHNRRSRDFTLNSLTEALREVIACFPVYRTYVTPEGVLDRDRRYVELAVGRAKRRSPATSASIFDFVRDVLLISGANCPDEAARADLLRFVGRFQQVTSPVMAKSVEDTAFYRYNRLVSLNEVGGDPEHFGTTLAAFHQNNLERQAHWPRSLLATATHDTKRGEDVRARIDVLSEVPHEFRTHVFKWARMNRGKKTMVEDDPAPSRNDEYLLYQTLLGSWPFEELDEEGRTRYAERIQQYMLKATHEAKAMTSWISPNEPYERATRDFVAGILEPSPRNVFLADFERFARRIAEFGIWNSLSQTVLKLTCPGVPDIYQGTELWDLSLVDPDNRRPVDYGLRHALLKSIRERAAQEDALPELARELVETRRDGRIKLYTIWRILRLHRDRPGFFATARYVPLDVRGSAKENICAFARKSPHESLVVVVPRLVHGLLGETGRLPHGADVWSDTEIPLPQQARGAKYRNIFTGERVEPVAADPGTAGSLVLADVLRTFPVAVLERVNLEAETHPS